MIDYTTVIGVDYKHLRQLQLVWPTWRKHKPSICDRPMIVFIDESGWPADGVAFDQVDNILTGHKDLYFYSWPMGGATYEADESIGKFGSAQRYKMLAGFVHIPSMMVKTKYWLKLDLDVVATGVDNWIDPEWFKDNPAIVSQKWGLTKPAMQMLWLDDWCERTGVMKGTLPLGLEPSSPDAKKLKHERIISWCGFFHTEFTKRCSLFAYSCGPYKLPVPSQDGYLWYCAKRLQLPIVRTNMKSRGWRWQSGLDNVRKAAGEAMR